MNTINNLLLKSHEATYGKKGMYVLRINSGEGNNKEMKFSAGHCVSPADWVQEKVDGWHNKEFVKNFVALASDAGFDISKGGDHLIDRKTGASMEVVVNVGSMYPKTEMNILTGYYLIPRHSFIMYGEMFGRREEIKQLKRYNKELKAQRRKELIQ